MKVDEKAMIRGTNTIEFQQKAFNTKRQRNKKKKKKKT